MKPSQNREPASFAIFAFKLYLAPGSRFYEAFSVILMSAGINVLTSSTNWFSSSSRLEALLLILAGIFLYFAAGRVQNFKERAREQYLLEEWGTEGEALEKVIATDLSDSSIKLFRDVLLLVSALAFTSLAICRIADTKESRRSTDIAPKIGITQGDTAPRVENK